MHNTIKFENVDGILVGSAYGLTITVDMRIKPDARGNRVARLGFRMGDGPDTGGYLMGPSRAIQYAYEQLRGWVQCGRHLRDAASIVQKS